MKKEYTVSEIIEHLKKLPQDAICITTNRNTMEQSGDAPLRLPTLYTTGKIIKESTRDAFDGTHYSYDNYSIFGGDMIFVKF